jgi:ADP-ribosyl-[dinitrogen reductase] hydrolase
MAIEKLRRGVPPSQAGDTVERSNGNGSLMRILPLAYYYQIWDFQLLLDRVHQISSITHAHPRSQMACGIYISIAIALLEGNDPQIAYRKGLDRIEPIHQKYPYNQERSHFDRVFSREIYRLPIEDINSEGYVIDTLEASLWCLLNSSSYPEAVLKAVNLGEDTDTSAAVTGGLASIYYGIESIPNDWMNAIARQEDIIALANRLDATIDSFMGSKL